MLARVVRKMEESSPEWLAYALRSARNLVWALLIQGLLNDSKLSELLEDFGRNLAKQPDLAEKLRGVATNRVLPVIKEVVNSNDTYKQRIKEEKYAFLRQKECFRRCMNVAEERYGWQRKTF